MRRAVVATLAIALAIFALDTRQSHAQTYGLDVHNLINPASGGMGGTSLARPQDVQSAIFGNPSTLAQFRGTQFSMAATWSEPTFDVTHTGCRESPAPIPASHRRRDACFPPSA